MCRCFGRGCHRTTYGTFILTDVSIEEIYTIYSSERIFSAEECAKLCEIGDALPQVDDYGEDLYDSKVSRDCVNAYLKRNDERDFVQEVWERIRQVIEEANETRWKYPIKYMAELLQYTTYTTGGHFNAHTDDPGPWINFVPPYISCSINLNCSSEWEGGELYFPEGSYREKGWDKPIHFEEQTAQQDIGIVHLYPSTMQHGVTPLTSGVRKVIVGWATKDIVKGMQK